MRCPRCAQEVLLATRCPYCGAATTAEPGGGALAGAGSGGGRAATGRFVGPMPPGREQAGRLTPWEWLRRLVAFLADGRVPGWKKGLIAAGVLYLLMPLDLMPDLLAGLGWLDDLLVAWFGMRALTRELGRYLPPWQR